MTAAKAALFLAVRELWRFDVLKTIHAIWLELRPMDDQSLTEVNTHRQSQNIILTCDNLIERVCIPDGHEQRRTLFARVRSALAELSSASKNHRRCKFCPLDDARK